MKSIKISSPKVSSKQKQKSQWFKPELHDSRISIACQEDRAEHIAENDSMPHSTCPYHLSVYHLQIITS